MNTSYDTIKAERAAGRRAAERLADEWPNRDWIPDTPPTEWAAAAVQRFAEIMGEQRSIFQASQQGAERGASTLSPRPFQGLLECLQNADDLAASELRIAYSGGRSPLLHIVHDGLPVTLANVGAMLLPWLSTKDDDAYASGRFGIGQKTLKALGGPIALHAPPFHFIMGDDRPEVCAPSVDIADIYQASSRHTMLVVPLSSKVSLEGVLAAVDELDARTLVFLNSIRAIRFRHLRDPSLNRDVAVSITPGRDVAITFDTGKGRVGVADLRLRTRGKLDRVRYRRYLVERPTPPGQARVNKATGRTTPLGLCVRLGGSGGSHLHDRVPMPVVIKAPIAFNAQFDPDSARSTPIPNEWNKHRIADLGSLTLWAASRAFAHDPRNAWHHVPLRREAAHDNAWIAEQLLVSVIGPCMDGLASGPHIALPSGPVGLDELSFEAPELEGLLDEADLTRLRPDQVPLPAAMRDTGGRWRDVLSDLALSDPVGVEEALALLDGETARTSEWLARLGCLALEQGLIESFLRRPSLMLADGQLVAAPRPGERRTLVRHAELGGLGVRLKVAQQLHPTYFEPAAEPLVARLEAEQVLVDRCDSASSVLAVLARGSVAAGAYDLIELGDGDLIEIRNTWNRLTRDQQKRLGEKLGRSVAVRAFWYEADGKQVSGFACPDEAYMPAAIDRETQSFAKAAGRTPGLKWIDADYAKLLRPTTARAGVGAQRLFSAWGVAREPRLVAPSNQRRAYTRDPTPSSPIHSVSRPDAQLQAIGYGYTDLIDDHWSPDFEQVIEHILSSPARTRRARAVSLLAVLARAWDKRYAEAQSAFPAKAYNGNWNRGPEVKATWLARASEQPWLPDAAGGLRSPPELRLPTPGVPIRSGDRSRTLGKIDGQILRSDLMAALGVLAGPTQAELVQQLEALRQRPPSGAINDEALLIYQLLAASLRDDSDRTAHGRLTAAQLRNAFRASPRSRGLLLVDGEWQSPEAVLKGPPIFGGHRAFAPNIEGLDTLWSALQIKLPSAVDAVQVLRELAAKPLTASTRGVMVATLRFLASHMDDLSPQMQAKLRNLPLWTGRAWMTSRPIYVLEGQALGESAPEDLAVWRPGISAFDGLQALMSALHVTPLSLKDFGPASVTTYGVAEGEVIRPTFAAAVHWLRQELIRADQALLDSMTAEWADLAQASVAVDPALRIAAIVDTGQRVELPAAAFMARDPLCLFVRSLNEIGQAEGAGQAIASLFAGDRQKIAWAWAAVWPRATEGDATETIIMPETKTQAARTGRLSELAEQAKARRASRSEKPQRRASPPRPTVQVRRLRDLAKLAPNEGEIVNQGVRENGFSLPKTRQRPGKRVFTKSPKGTESRPAPRTVLPPVNDREALALEVVRRALQLDIQQINDLRQKRGLGVDAIDELRQCYEIKMSASADIPSEVYLTPSEVAAARTDPDFFLAIVTGLEEGQGILRARFIFDPLQNLAVKVKNGLTLTGVDRVEALEYRFITESTKPG